MKALTSNSFLYITAHQNFDSRPTTKVGTYRLSKERFLLLTFVDDFKRKVKNKKLYSKLESVLEIGNKFLEVHNVANYFI